MMMIQSSIVIILVFLFFSVRENHGFHPITEHSNRNSFHNANKQQQQRQQPLRLLIRKPKILKKKNCLLNLSSSSLGSQNFDIDAASEKLLWENLQEMKERPVLDLSARRRETMSLSRTDEVNNAEDGKNDNKLEGIVQLATSDWDKGQLWNLTKHGLYNLGVPYETSDQFLCKCPQLIRLDPNMVIETTQWIINEFGIEFLLNKSDPRILSFPCSDVSYGLQFTSQMMMSPISTVKTLCVAAPELLLGGIEGGLQEQAAKDALSTAGDATYKANQKAVGDAAAAFNLLQQKKGPKGL